ncbi:MAG: serine/threonine-protein kinase [Planctomycetes bacterium]|nr:serine/threonine-protein kinase [Planctomycetota bacterium]
MTLATGKTLAHYSILAPLGAGAMGEVYRARDTKLGREVAIKVLPEHFADDEERLRRFQREATLLAALNHPNVAQIFGVDRDGDVCFLVLELVPGESLQDRLTRGALPVDEAIDVCRQIAEGLEAAHEAGVIHRDLKPANVRLTPDGIVKLLDFGIAKRVQSADDTTISDSGLVTEPGRLLGTPSYMAPEQARGKPIDRRVDVWAFGCVLYECLAGQRPFAGAMLSDVLAAVLEREPDLSKLPDATPPHVRRLIELCLDKDPRRRLRDIGEARLVLEGARVHATTTDDASSPARAYRRSLAWIPWAAVVVLAAMVAYFAVRSPRPISSPIVRAILPLPVDAVLETADGGLALSPDGRTLAFVATLRGETRRLWVRPIDSLTAQPLVGTDNATYPFWSPDGETIAFFADGKLKRIQAAGGSVSTICDGAEGRGGSWGRDGTIVFCPGAFQGLYRVPSKGGAMSPLTQVPENGTDRLPHFLPDGRHVLYTLSRGRVQTEDGVRLLDLVDGTSVPVLDDPSAALYTPPGLIVFVRNGSVMAQPFDAETGKPGGEAVLLAEHVDFNPLRYTGAYSVSATGTLVYQSAAMQLRLEWFDLDGRSLGAIGEPAAFRHIALSPDGERAAVTIQRGNCKEDLWLFDTRQGLGVKFFEDTYDRATAWSPDGRRVAYSQSADQATYIRSTEGSKEATLVTKGWPTDWSRDGSWLSITRQTSKTGLDVFLASPKGGDEPIPFAATASVENFGTFSLDGRWLAYAANESGRRELYLTPVTGSGPARQVTAVGASGKFAWLDDGRIVFVEAVHHFVFSVDVRSNGERLEIGTPKQLFGNRALPRGAIAFSRDGKRLLAAVAVGDDPSDSITLVQNWPAAIGMTKE